MFRSASSLRWNTPLLLILVATGLYAQQPPYDVFPPQYCDTPPQPLVRMHYTDTKAVPGTKLTYQVIAVNTVNLQSMPSADSVAISGKVITNTIRMKLGYIPPGTFTMGSPPSEQEQYQKDNTDDFAAQEIQHEVSITKGFYMGVHAVTQEEYETVMGKNPSFFSAAGRGKDKVADLNTRHFPVEWVSWDDAAEFCKKLSQKEGKTYRLPTEAEWEFACRAGTKTAYYFGDTISTDQANYAGGHVYGNGKKGVDRERPTPVGSFPANALGLYDMHGNVWQWCQDWYDKDYYRKSPINDPVNETAGKLKLRVLRGGSWHNLPGGARSACRFLATPVLRNWNYGFRIVASSLPAGEKAKTAPVEPKTNEPSDKVITNSIGMELVYIPPGKFLMGSPRSEQEQYKKDSRVGGNWAAQEIQHEVAITKGFLHGRSCSDAGGVRGRDGQDSQLVQRNRRR